MPIAVIADVAHIVVAILLNTERSRTRQESIVIDELSISLLVAVRIYNMISPDRWSGEQQLVWRLWFYGGILWSLLNAVLFELGFRDVLLRLISIGLAFLLLGIGWLWYARATGANRPILPDDLETGEDRGSEP